MLSRHQVETPRRSLRPLIALILFLASSGLLAGEVTNRLPNHSATIPPFVLSTQQGRISPDAIDASLIAIVQQIRREVDIRLDTYHIASSSVSNTFCTDA